VDLYHKWVTEFVNLDRTVADHRDGLDNTKFNDSPIWLDNPDTGERISLTSPEDVKTYISRGWKLGLQEQYEAMHLQAWLFQEKHFQRLSWVRLDAPEGEWFITNDMVVTWLVDGYAETPPAALGDPLAQMVAPLTRKTVLLGRNETRSAQVTPREINRFIACTASRWVAGPNRDVVEQALQEAALDTGNLRQSARALQGEPNFRKEPEPALLPQQVIDRGSEEGTEAAQHPLAAYRMFPPGGFIACHANYYQ